MVLFPALFLLCVTRGEGGRGGINQLFQYGSANRKQNGGNLHMVNHHKKGLMPVP